jgi:DinB superfamily
VSTENVNDTILRDQLIKLLRGGEAHIFFDELTDGFPVDLCHEKIQGLPYTAWQVLEHIRIAQWDIVEFARNPDYVSPDFPEGYWPAEAGSPDLWIQTLARIREDLRETEAIVSDPATDLFQRIPHGTGQTFLRQALLIADHNSYHLGALTLMKRLLQDGTPGTKM